MMLFGFPHISAWENQIFQFWFEILQFFQNALYVSKLLFHKCLIEVHQLLYLQLGLEVTIEKSPTKLAPKAKVVPRQRDSAGIPLWVHYPHFYCIRVMFIKNWDLLI